MAVQSLIIILAVLLVLLALGVPIAYSIGISALAAILATMDMNVAVITAAQRTFVGIHSCQSECRVSSDAYRKNSICTHLRVR